MSSGGRRGSLWRRATGPSREGAEARFRRELCGVPAEVSVRSGGTTGACGVFGGRFRGLRAGFSAGDNGRGVSERGPDAGFGGIRSVLGVSWGAGVGRGAVACGGGLLPEACWGTSAGCGSPGRTVRFWGCCRSGTGAGERKGRFASCCATSFGISGLLKVVRFSPDFSVGEPILRKNTEKGAFPVFCRITMQGLGRLCFACKNSCGITGLAV